MLDNQKLFGNYFSEEKIIPARLLNFGNSTLNNLTVANNDGQYTALITALSGPLENLADEFIGGFEDRGAQEWLQLSDTGVGRVHLVEGGDQGLDFGILGEREAGVRRFF